MQEIAFTLYFERLEHEPRTLQEAAKQFSNRMTKPSLHQSLRHRTRQGTRPISAPNPSETIYKLELYSQLLWLLAKASAGYAWSLAALRLRMRVRR